MTILFIKYVRNTDLFFVYFGCLQITLTDKMYLDFPWALVTPVQAIMVGICKKQYLDLTRFKLDSSK